MHVIQRGNNRQACFYAEEDYRVYLDWLSKYADEAKCLIHAYVLMTNHVHLLLTPLRANGAGDLMKRLGQRYVQYVNRTYRRSGSLWEGRFRSCLTQEDEYVLGCYRYIEMNPVRANMVVHPGDYPWSSYGANAQGRLREVLTSHTLYDALGSSAAERQVRYQEMFRQQLESDLVNEIRQATNGNFALGSSRFQAQVEAALGRRVKRAKPGRPRRRDGEQATRGLYDKSA
jgi:putative transposase